jgi:glucoamylase
MEQFAVGIGLIPEQVWDEKAIPEKLLQFGGPTGSAIPLVWAHAEYIKLVRSVADTQVFDCIEPVRARYSSGRHGSPNPIEFWSHKRRVESLPAGGRLRVIAGTPFTLQWTTNEWQDRTNTTATPTTLKVWFVDVPTESVTGVRFIFFFPAEDRWEREEHSVAIDQRRTTNDQ